MADEKTFKLKIISPDRVFFEDDVTMVELATSEGEMGVYAGHIPLTSVLVPDTVKIHKGDDVKKAAIHSGFIEVMPDSVTILAEIAEWPDEIDVNRANEARIRAERRLASHDSNVNVMRAELALKRSLARLGAVD
ncbi:MAG: ATP synthase F1 subunit epsilon [Bacteroides sp.]|nr:ATP synthase F1 subunit epsilon [Clostridia bacterium]